MTASGSTWRLRMGCENPRTDRQLPLPTTNVKHVYTVREIAEMTGFSVPTVIRLFEHEKGVIILGRAETTHKRRYRSIRIPRAVYERVLARLTLK